MRATGIVMWLLFVTMTSFCCLAQSNSNAQIESGRILFRVNCGPCHAVHREKFGPMLASITRKKTEAWLRAFIRNSQEVILEGDAYANFLYRQYNQTVMPSFEELSEDEINDILFYIEHESFDPQEEMVVDTRPDMRGRPEVLQGKALFDEQCASCHFIGKEGYGPALGSVTKRIPRPWLVNFIRNSQEVIASGDPYAVYVFDQFDRRVMVTMEFLSDEEINAMLDYIEYASAAPRNEAGENGRPLLAQSVQPAGYVSDVAQPQAGKLFRIFLVLTFVVSGGVLFYLIRRFFLYLE